MKRSSYICLATVLVVSIPMIFRSKPVEAGWFHDLTGIRTPRVIRNMDPTRPLPSEGSCLAVMTNDVYKVTLVNEKSYKQTYYFDNQEYTLRPGYQRTHNKTIASGSNSCNVQRYPLPVVEFDRYSDDGQYTARRVGLQRNQTKYTFWKDGNIIKFSTKN